MLFLGPRLDEATQKPLEERLSIESHQLTTHGVIVGMTGSGKTGLGVVLLEEVLSAGIPALILDPKGDMGNLLLNFPEMRSDDFLPWIDEGEARREGVERSDLAAATARRWRTGLESVGIDASRMSALRDSVDMRILTPGSSAGIGLNVLGDLAAPDVSWEEQGESVREEIEGLVSGILVLAGMEADPLTSREHILLSNLIEHAWREGRGLDLATLLLQVQDPPLRRLGVFDIEAFFPKRDRTKLAMRLNGLVASPSFGEWLQGEPLDVQRLLWSEDGRPRASVVYLSHLTESERQFVVTLLLSKVVTWMRGQPGTSDLRALVYVDEVFGMAPPTAEPPSKRPMLTIFKQARAHGVGMVVSTQNPVDLDYKIMSNAGTWMVGRLQTERDKARIIEGMRAASGDVDVGAWDRRIGDLGKRQFVLKSAKSPHPVLFTTRWAMSYLRGPLTRNEIGTLMASSRTDADVAQQSDAGVTATGAPDLEHDESPVMPEVASRVPVRFVDPAAPWLSAIGAGAHSGRLAAGVAVGMSLLFDEARADLRHTERWEAVLFPLPESPQFADAIGVDHDPRDFRAEAPEAAVFKLPEAPIAKAAFFRDLEKELKQSLLVSETMELRRNRELKLYSRPGESPEDFLERCMAAAETEADEEASKLRSRFEKRLATAERTAVSAERRVRELEVDVGQRRQQEVVAGVGDVLSAFLGGRRRMRSLSGAASRRSTTRRTAERLRSAEEKLEGAQETIEELEAELTEELEGIWEKWQSVAGEVEPLEVGLEKTDIRVEELVLFWAPVS